MSGPGRPATRIESRDNPLLRQLRQLLDQPQAYRKLGLCWVEGDHLCDAALAQGVVPSVALLSESTRGAVPDRVASLADRVVVLPDRLFAALGTLPSPAGFGFLMPVPAAAEPLGGVATVILDRVQDAGNVGSILRSAAAFGCRQVLALVGTAGLWSPKVLRAGMGAHFGLHLVESLDERGLAGLGVPLLSTSSHAGAWLHTCRLPWPCAWIFGHEGQGVGPTLDAMAGQQVRIAQPGGQESLNVAAAAAICLHASATRAWDGDGSAGDEAGSPSL